MRGNWTAFIESIEPTPRRQSLAPFIRANRAIFPVTNAPGMIITASGDIAILTDITLADMPEWWELRGCCSKCRHNTPLSRKQLSRRGLNVSLLNWRRYLRCEACGNTEGNVFAARKIPRD